MKYPPGSNHKFSQKQGTKLQNQSCPAVPSHHRRHRQDSSTMTTVHLRHASYLLLLLFLLLFLQTRSEVITLTSDTFSDKVKEKDTVWFVKFCVPWCKHCKNLGTLWEDLAKVVEGEDEIEIGQVDCTMEKPACNKVDIHSYPTFKVFYDGEEFAKYKGPKEVQSLKKFVLDEAEKASRSKLEDDRDSL